ncbi:MAG: molybdate ABC transporter substrate-binding protein [Chloroflexota bacterium]|nr:molybdate ABC transporter substrate-binding protein [Chloroflexota bacterium]
MAAPASAARPPAPSYASSAITVVADSALKPALTALATAFQTANGVLVSLHFDSSSALVAQVASTSADVIVVNSVQMAAIPASSLSAPAVTVARDDLVVVAATKSKHRVCALADLGAPGVRVAIPPSSTPETADLGSVLISMANDAAFGSDFVTRVDANLRSLSRAGAVLTRVANGQADAGLVYAGDVRGKAASKVRVRAIPSAYNRYTVYQAAVPKSSQSQDSARRFITFAQAPAGQAVLQSQGAIPEPPPGGHAPSAQIDGLILRPALLTVVAARAMPVTSVTATLRSQKGVIGTDTYTGMLLCDLLQAQGAMTNPTFKNDMLRQLITVDGSDGYQVAVAMAEILPQFGHEQVLLAYAKNGSSLSQTEGAFELIVPGDNLAGRDVKNVTHITLGAPPVGPP